MGISSRPFSNQIGQASRVGASANLYLGSLFRHLGLFAGYAITKQTWAIEASSVPLPDIRTSRWRYREIQHIFRLGINWE